MCFYAYQGVLWELQFLLLKKTRGVKHKAREPESDHWTAYENET